MNFDFQTTACFQGRFCSSGSCPYHDHEAEEEDRPSCDDCFQAVPVKENRYGDYICADCWRKDDEEEAA